MSGVLLILLLLAAAAAQDCGRAHQATLRQVAFLHRHGDRTPISFAPGDPLARDPLWARAGLGQLTDAGRRRAHLLGRLARHRYNALLGDSAERAQVASRSSGSARCLESAQLFLAGLLALDAAEPSDGPAFAWDSSELARRWQPASVQVVPEEMDGMLACAKCLALRHEHEQVIAAADSTRAIQREFAREAQVLERHFNVSMGAHLMSWSHMASNLEAERVHLGPKLDAELAALLPRLAEAADRAMGAYQSTWLARRLRAGLLVGELLRNLRAGAEPEGGCPKAKLLHYSTHDLVLVALLGALAEWDQHPHAPAFAASLMLELHQEADGEHHVRAFYLAQVEGASEPEELQLGGCRRDARGRCTLAAFEELVGAHAIGSWQSWMRECGNSLYDVNPYRAAAAAAAAAAATAN